METYTPTGMDIIIGTLNGAIVIIVISFILVILVKLLKHYTKPENSEKIIDAITGTTDMITDQVTELSGKAKRISDTKQPIQAGTIEDIELSTFRTQLISLADLVSGLRADYQANYELSEAYKKLLSCFSKRDESGSRYLVLSDEYTLISYEVSDTEILRLFKISELEYDAGQAAECIAYILKMVGRSSRKAMRCSESASDIRMMVAEMKDRMTTIEIHQENAKAANIVKDLNSRLTIMDHTLLIHGETDHNVQNYLSMSSGE